MAFLATFSLLFVLLIAAATADQPPPQAQAMTAVGGEVTLVGVFHVVWGDGPRGSGIVKYAYQITDDLGHSTRVTLDEAAPTPLGHPVNLNGKRVMLVGERVTQVGPAQLRTGEPTIRIRALQLVDSDAVIPQAVVAGSKPYVVLPCRFSDSTGVTPRDTTYFTNLMGTSSPQLDHYWREVSYDNINLTGTSIKDWVNLPSPRSTYVTGNQSGDADLTLLVNDCTAAHDATVDFPSFSGIALMFNQDLDCCAWGGSRSLTLDGQTKTYSVVWMPPWAYANQDILAHEMGHGFGFPHSSGPYGQTYDSNWDVMSGGGICSPPDVTYGCIGVHTISYHKDRLATWIPTQRKFLAVEGTFHTLNLERLAQPPNNSNFLMAEIPFGSKFYTVEVREFAGYDSQLPGQGVIIHEVDASRASHALVVDATNDNNPNDAGAAWTPGETFSDATNGITVAVNSSNSPFNVTLTRKFVAFNPTAFTDDIEGSTSGYFGQNTWAVTTADSHSPTHSWTDSPASDYANNLNSALFTPFFSLKGFATATLTFWHKRTLGTGDSVNVFIRLANGSFTFLTGFNTSSANWEQVTVNLNAHAGLESTRLAFQLLSDSTGTADGWYIDDIVVTGTAANNAPVGSLESAVDQADQDGTVVQGGTLVVKGWAGDEEDGAPITKVEVSVDGNLVGNATLGGSRADVATALNDSRLDDSGWTRSVSTAALSLGMHTVSAVAFDSNGASTTLPGTRTFQVAASGSAPALFGVTACCPNQFVGIDPATGGFTVLSSVGGATDRIAGGAVAVIASAHRFYLAKRSPARLVSIDTTNGAATETALSKDIIGLGFHTTAGTLFGVTACCPNQLVSINVGTGALTVVGSVGTAADRFAATAAIDPGNNRFFLAKRGSPKLLIIDTTTGGTTERTLSQEIVRLGFESSTSTLFGVTACCPSQFVSINVATGALTAVGTAGTGSDRFALAVAIDPSNNRCYLAKRASPRLVIIETGSGAAIERAVSQEILLLAVE